MDCLPRRAYQPAHREMQAALSIHVRFLQLQQRRTEQVDDQGGYVSVPELRVGAERWFTWDEAVEVESSRTVLLADLVSGASWIVAAEATESIEPVHDQNGKAAGRLARQRWAVAATVAARPSPSPCTLSVSIDNQATVDGLAGKDDSVRRSLLGTHMIVESHDPQVAFVSVIDPPDYAQEAAQQCTQHRCWPVLVGEPGEASAVLGSPIILYDYPEIAGRHRVTLRRHRDRRNPDAAGAHDDRRRKGGGAGDRSKGCRDHRSLRCDVTRGPDAAAWHIPRSGPNATLVD